MKNLLSTLGLFGTLASALAADPAITVAPQSRVVRVGDPVAFAIAASGTATLGYQWSYNGSPITGATTTSYALSNVQLANAGTYSVVVTNSLGSASASATLSVSAGLLRLYPTNLVVLRAGSGTAALATTGNPLFLDQLTPNGTYVSTVAIPDSGPNALIGFNGLVDHYMSSSANNRAVTFGGWNVSRPFSANLSSSLASAAPRGVGAINGLGYYVLALSDTNSVFDKRRLQGVTSTDGATQFWTSAAAGGVNYVTPTPGSDSSVTTLGARSAAAIYGGNLYFCLSGGLYEFSGLPTSLSLPTQLLSAANPNDFALSPDGNTLYLTDGSNMSTGGGGVQRWDWDAVNAMWTKSYTFVTPGPASGNNGPDGLVVDFSQFTGGQSGSGAVIYATTGDATQSSVVRIVDTGAGSTVTVLYTAGVNQVVRGIRFAPVADPPTITAQPVDASIVPGGTAQFSVVVAGSAPFSYQWQKNGAPLSDGGNIAGATAATLNVANVSSADVATYSVVVTNGVGSVTSANAALSLSAADPGIAVPPQNTTTNAGATVTLTAQAVGSSPLSYRWQKDGADLADGPSASGGTISGSGTATLKIAGVGCADTGNYLVKVSNPRGNATSASALLSINDPYVVQPPTSQVLLSGGTATFTVQARGSGPFSYTWYKDGSALFDGGNVSGSSTASLTVSGVSTTDVGAYAVAVMGACGTNAWSAPANVALLTPPQPRTVRAGDDVAFVAGVTGTGPFSYQWSYNGVPVTGATNSSYFLGNVQLANAGTYSVVVSPVGGRSASGSATLTVAQGRLRFYPSNLVLLRAGDGTTNLTTTGNTLFLDQFTTNGEYVSSTMIPDQGPSALLGFNALVDEYMTISTNNRFLNFAGYNVTKPYSGNVATAPSAAVPRGIGAVNGLGYYSLAVSDTNLYSGARFLFAVSPDGQKEFWTSALAGGIQYVVPGQSDVQISATSGDPGNGNLHGLAICGGNLYVACANGPTRGIFKFDGLPTSSNTPSFLFATTYPNELTVSPDGKTIYVTDGGNVSTGTGGVQRWDQDGSGAWSLTYTFAPPTATTTGNNGPDGLVVDFSGFTGGGAAGFGAVLYVTTGEATANKLVKIVDMGAGSPVTVLAAAGPNQVMRGVRFAPIADPVAITAQPTDQTATAGTTASFSVHATGSEPLSYQWQFKGAPIAGATLSTLTLNNVQPADAGSYSVVVTNDLNSVTSGSATLAVSGAVRPVLRIGVSGTVVTISWANAVPGTTYRVQYKTSVASQWTDLTPDVVASSTTASKTDTLGSGPRFYRVIVP